MSHEDVPVRARLRGDRVLRRNRGEEDRGLLLRPLRQQPEGRRRGHERAAEAAFPEEGERRRIRGRARRPIVWQHQLRPAEIARGTKSPERSRSSSKGKPNRSWETDLTLGNGLRPLFSARAETGRYRQVLSIHFQVTRFFFRDDAIQGGHKYSCGIHLPGKPIRRRL